MPHLTAAHARMQGGKNSARVPPHPHPHPRPYGQADLTSFRRSRDKLRSSVEAAELQDVVESSTIDVSDRVSEVSLLTLLNAQ